MALRPRFSWLAWAFIVLLLEVTTGLAQTENASEKPAKPKPAAPEPKITISKETTWVTEPTRPDGSINYFEAVNRRFSEGVTVENNAAVILYRAFGPQPEGVRQPDHFFERLGMEVPPDGGNFFRPTGGRHAALVAATEKPWKSAEHPEVAEWLNQNEEALIAVAEATERTRYFSPLVPSRANADEPLLEVRLPGVQVSRDVARALAARAMRHLGEGSQFDAWRDLMATHRLGRLVGQGPTLIEFLVGVAIETIAINGELEFLATTKPSAKLLTMYRKQLDRLPPRPSIADKLDVERAMYLDVTIRLARGKLTLEQLGADLGGDEPVIGKLAEKNVLAAIDWNVVLKSGNGWYDRLVAAVRHQDYQERHAALTSLDEDLKARVEKHRNPAGLLGLLGNREAIADALSDLMVSLMLPAARQVAVTDDRTTQRMRHLEIAFALARWRADHGDFPESLNQLATKYLSAVPNDLFGGKPLKYAVTDDGIRLYSVGPNEQDEDGRGPEDKPPGDDIQIRLPTSRK